MIFVGKIYYLKVWVLQVNWKLHEKSKKLFSTDQSTDWKIKNNCSKSIEAPGKNHSIRGTQKFTGIEHLNKDIRSPEVEQQDVTLTSWLKEDNSAPST